MEGLDYEVGILLGFVVVVLIDFLDGEVGDALAGWLAV